MAESRGRRQLLTHARRIHWGRAQPAEATTAAARACLSRRPMPDEAMVGSWWRSTNLGFEGKRGAGKSGEERGRGGRGRGGGRARTMDGSRKRKIETRGAEAAEEEQRKKLQLKLGKVHCNYCKRDVSDQMYIKSAVPAPPRPAPPRPAPNTSHPALLASEAAGCLPACAK